MDNTAPCSVFRAPFSEFSVFAGFSVFSDPTYTVSYTATIIP